MRRAKPSLLAGPSGKSRCLKATVKIRYESGRDLVFPISWVAFLPIIVLIQTPLSTPANRRFRACHAAL
jgi:hypothetical protein